MKDIKRTVELEELGALRCPCCNNTNLNQVSLTAYWRKHEDSREGITTKSSANGVTTHSFVINSPSHRRNGLTIDFVCENCEGEPRLSIIQEKGTTYLMWNSARVGL